MSDLINVDNAHRTFPELISAQSGAPLLTDDVLVLVLPLFRQVAKLHELGKIAVTNIIDIQVDSNGALTLCNEEGEVPRLNIGAVKRIQPQTISGLNLVGTLQSIHTQEGGLQVSDSAVQLDMQAPIERPVYLLGPSSWETLIGHHDEITDVFLLGMVLASLACGLNFADEDDLHSFVWHRQNLFALNENLHPIIAAVIVQMTEINRHDRATDMAELTTRLRTWREQPTRSGC